ncbi:MAG: DUF4294 domain-containing protein [Bacteroidetes bacterium]|nr:DUF4294 domain-containing protein [Bacteroidota bacterium]MCK6610049.1 DUF4294 domain-containing protein [Bacteroidia bacterium]
MKTFWSLILVILVSTSVLKAQEQQPDTLRSMMLPDFIVKAKKDPEYEKRYQRLVYNVKKVLPYAKMASFRFQMMEQNLQLLPTEKARKEYLKRTEKSIKDQFMDDLMKMTQSQGRILIKLIYRETGKTTYELLQNYRGGLTAIYWQGMAKVFNANLKEEFDPVEDWQIEQIIKQLGFE